MELHFSHLDLPAKAVACTGDAPLIEAVHYDVLGAAGTRYQLVGALIGRKKLFAVG